MLTKDWMMMVLRSSPSHQGVPVNSLGYLGLLWAKNEDQKKIIEQTQPIEMLQALSVPMHQANNNSNNNINNRDADYFNRR